MKKDLLKMEGITKVYPNGILACNDVSFSIKESEIHGLIGENGAGKSTLMKILFGLETAQEGNIFLKEKKINITSPDMAIKYDIGMVHQHFMLVPSLTVAENIVLGIEPKKGILFDIKKAVELTEQLSKKYNLHVDPMAKVQNISVGLKQRVEILKALLRGAKILILDEPTAVLTPQETEELFKELVLLKEKGHTIIFISHKLRELKELCDRVTIMRNGKNVGVFNINDVTEEDISRKMVGRDLVCRIEKEKFQPKEMILNVEGLTYINDLNKKKLNNVSFSLRKGEILGVAGVDGNGQSELVEIITGLNKSYKGNVFIKDKNIKMLSIKKIRELGMSYIPEDRMTYGVAKNASIEDNLITNNYDSEKFSKNGLLKIKRIHEQSKKLIKDYNIKGNSYKQLVKMLSGGNIQKVVAAREISFKPKVLIADQPTRGIDVGASEFIRQRIINERDKGCGVLLISADLNEVIELSDSLIVIFDGEIVAYFYDTSLIEEKELGLYMLGLKRQSIDQIRRAIHE